LIEGMKRNKIKKISAARITEAAFDFGHALTEEIGNPELFGQKKWDSLERAENVRIEMLYPGNTHLSGIEKQVMEAYAEGSVNGQPGDNVQRFGKDSILYTKPFMKELPDGSFHFKFALGIRISVKHVVLSIKD
jgi:hypothetical protein